MIGFFLSLVSLLIAILVVVSKLIRWNEFQFGLAAVSTGVFFLGSVQLFFIGMLGEYIMAINDKTAGHPLIVEEERINFEDEHKGKESET